MKSYNAAIYLRLSKEDREKNNSIDAQREITTKYAKEHGFNILEEYVDNGFSGMLDSRPSLNRMMVDIIRNKINMVIVKDMSRLTRDKNLTSYYTDIFFPDNDVRLISVTEYVDTGERYEIDDVVALRGIINQSYLEDISKKIKSVKANFKKQGKFIEGSVAYGYKKDKEDKHKIVIDREVEWVIKDIFVSYINGIGPKKIAERLNEQKVLTPAQYLKLKNKGKEWNREIISRILDSPIYAGMLVTNKYENNFIMKKRTATRKGDYKCIENTHEPIISKEDFEKVQKMRGSRCRKNHNTYLYLLKGFVYCKHCGRKMNYKNNYPFGIDSKGKTIGKKNEKGYFSCEVHYRHKEFCNITNNTIKEKELNRIVLDTLSNRLKELQLKKYAKEVKDLMDKQNIEISDLKKVRSEIAKQESDFKLLYSKKVEGIIDEDEFIRKYDEYKKDVQNLKEQLKRVRRKRKNLRI